MIKKFICKIFGHNYSDGDTRTYSISVGNLGNITIQQNECTRCGHIITTADLATDITYDNLIKVCSTTVDKSIGEVIYPVDTKIESAIRKPRTKKSAQSNA